MFCDYSAKSTIPETALNNAFDDMRESGLEGLKKHLTSNARKKVESFESISGRPEIAIFSMALIGGNAVTFLMDKLSEYKLTLPQGNTDQAAES